MQAQINKSMEPLLKKYKNPDVHNMKGEGNKDQFDFNLFLLLYKNANSRY